MRWGAAQWTPEDEARRRLAARGMLGPMLEEEPQVEKEPGDGIEEREGE